MEEDNVRRDTFENIGCESTSVQCGKVSVPIKLKPNAEVGEAKVCCCYGPSVCINKVCGSDCEYEIVITQNVVVKIPITYKAEAEAGEAEMDCTKCPPFI